jgi:hypothetical protein
VRVRGIETGPGEEREERMSRMVSVFRVSSMVDRGSVVILWVVRCSSACSRDLGERKRRTRIDPAARIDEDEREGVGGDGDDLGGRERASTTPRTPCDSRCSPCSS